MEPQPQPQPQLDQNTFLSLMCHLIAQQGVEGSIDVKNISELPNIMYQLEIKQNKETDSITLSVKKYIKTEVFNGRSN